MTSDTILASGLREGDIIKRQGRPDTLVLSIVRTSTHMLVTAQLVLTYRRNDPVVVDRPELHTRGEN